MNDQSQTDDRLILAVQNGSDEAFALLYNKYEGQLMGYLYFKIRNPESAEEIFQISWSKVLNSIHKYKFTDTFSSWLFTIAGNSVKDWYKKASNQNKLLESFRISQDNSSQQSNDQNLDLNFLKPEAKQVIELQYVLGKTSKEIADELSLTESNVRKISSRAKQKIREHVLNGGSLA